YSLNAKFALSQLMVTGKNIIGYSHNVGIRKSGNWSFELGEELVDDKYDINDMGILYNNNFVDHFLWTSYRWLKPRKWYNRIQVNYNGYYSLLYKDLPCQKISSKFQNFN